MYKNNDVGDIEIQTVEPLTTETALLEIEVNMEKVQVSKYRIDQILAELIQDSNDTLSLFTEI